MKKKVKLEKIEISWVEEGIIENYFMGEKMIEVNDVKELRNTNLEIADHKPYTVLVMAEELASFSRETRELLASKEFVGKTKAKALVINGLGQRIMANFYLHINKPFIKTRLFNDRNKAIEWLRGEYLNIKVPHAE